ncbi:MAG: hypothetical protein ACRD9R_24085 [Pyrinomonadaceae bacterium]
MSMRCLALLFLYLACGANTGTLAQDASRVAPVDAEFGPVVRAYLGYLRAEQEVVDDRASRREIRPAYYRRNSNRIRALTRMTVKLARETRTDYVPELYAVAADEFGTLFDPLPRSRAFAAGEIVNDTFRFLGIVRNVETFYVFARLDIYEQAELLQKKEAGRPVEGSAAPAANMRDVSGGSMTRPRRAHTP